MTADNYVTIQSNQFINLTAGDELKSIGLTTSDDDSEFHPCSSAEYVSNGSAGELPTINVEGCH